MKRVNQYERTSRDITNALLALLTRKSLEKISVQDILDEAMVNRSTFYQHFPDKYAVLEELQSTLISGMVTAIDTCAAEYGWDLAHLNETVCAYLSEHREQMRRLLAIRSENLNLEGRMREIFTDYLRRSDTRMNALETEMLATLTVSFLVRFLNQEDHSFQEQAMSSLMLDTWLHMSLFFFRVENAEHAEERILDLMREMHRELREQE